MPEPTVVDAIASLTADGYTADFRITSDGVVWDSADGTGQNRTPLRAQRRDGLGGCAGVGRRMEHEVEPAAGGEFSNPVREARVRGIELGICSDATGGGPRVCIGNAFAMMEATLLLATIAREFRPRVVRPEGVVPLPTMTLRPLGGIEVVLEARR